VPASYSAYPPERVQRRKEIDSHAQFTHAIGRSEVTEEEYAEIEKQAEAKGQNVGEWCRKVILAEVERGETPSAETILKIRGKRDSDRPACVCRLAQGRTSMAVLYTHTDKSVTLQNGFYCMQEVLICIQLENVSHGSVA
jgi:hypothetical protein